MNAMFKSFIIPGNIALNIITSQYRYQLRIEVGDWEGNTIYANYQMFRVGTPAEKYKLEVDGYSGNAGKLNVTRLRW